MCNGQPVPSHPSADAELPLDHLDGGPVNLVRRALIQQTRCQQCRPARLGLLLHVLARPAGRQVDCAQCPSK